MIALMQMIVRYGFLKIQDISLALNEWQYALLVLATVSLAAAGYAINNIFDQETDTINKPQDVVVGQSISENNAYTIYSILNILGVGIGFYLSNAIGHAGFSAIFIIIAGTLYLYASGIKQGLLIGNFLIAVITSFSIIIIGLFDLYPLVTPENHLALGTYFELLLDYAVFCFIINFIRELVKDLEDINGDYNLGMRTLPIVLGVSRTVKVVFVLGFVPVLILLFYINTNYILNNLFFAAAYTLLAIVGPLVYFVIKIWSASSQQDFHHLSNVLKIVLFLGIFTILIVTLNVKYHA
jgi:4-hydroxybenzoate polyprenyltransferase